MNTIKNKLSDIPFGISPDKPIDSDKFVCKAQGLESYQIFIQNGYIKPFTQKKLEDLGVIIASSKQNPSKYNDYKSIYTPLDEDDAYKINAENIEEVLFIYIPENVCLDKPIQIIHLVNSATPAWVHSKTLIVLEKFSALQLIQCTDSNQFAKVFTNSITEVYLKENASLSLYGMQNLNNDSELSNKHYIFQEKSSKLESFSISLNGAKLLNNQKVELNGKDCFSKIYGLYLMDQNQRVDNYVFVQHKHENCESVQLFKGILDDHSQGYFKGHVQVLKEAQKTLALQSNKNLLLTNKAKFTTLPQLEIYADDVKCSHGATVGQIDENALFYLRARGISLTQAKRLLMYAFTHEIIDKIQIEAIRANVAAIVKKRLDGELSACDQCVMHCPTESNICQNP